jgi:hypothetical protein
MAQLLALAYVAAGLAPARPVGLAAATRSPTRRHGARSETLAAGAAAVALSLTVALSVAPARLAPDPFASLALQLSHAPQGTLVSAAPDAYGFLLPERPEQSLRPGRRGLILLDAAQRTYQPGLSARGAIVAHLSVPHGFRQPNGTLDTGPAVLVRGVVTPAAAG